MTKQTIIQKLKKSDASEGTFEQKFEHAMEYLASPCKLWLSDSYQDKRTALKLTFTGRLAYDRKTGLRTPQVSEAFTFLGDIMQKRKMAHPEGETSNALFEELEDWEHQLRHLDFVWNSQTNDIEEPQP